MCVRLFGRAYTGLWWWYGKKRGCKGGVLVSYANTIECEPFSPRLYETAVWSLRRRNGWNKVPFVNGLWWIDNRHVSTSNGGWKEKREANSDLWEWLKKWQTLFVSPRAYFSPYPTRLLLSRCRRWRQAVWKILPWLISYKIDTIVTQIPKF